MTFSKAAITSLAILITCSVPARAESIHSAARDGDLAAMRQILAREPTLIDTKDEDENTPLHLAALAGHSDVAELLLAQGAAINAGDRENSTALDVAAQQGHLGTVKLLLDRGADLKHQDVNGMTALHFAAYRGHVEVARLLIDAGADVRVGRANGSTPMHGAALNGHVETIKLLLARGANVNAPNDNGYLPIHAAAIGGQEDTVALLLEQGATPDAKTNDGGTPLLLALLNNGREPVVDLLLAAGADVNVANNDGITPLFAAAHGGQAGIVERLLAKGAPADARVNGAPTPLLAAARSGHTDAAALLIEHGADVNAQAPDGQTPLSLAVNGGHKDTVALLLAKGAPVDAREPHFGRTALHLAAIKGDRELVELLLNHQADRNAADSSGRTPRYYAGRHGHRDVAELLTTNEIAASDLDDNFGHSPLLAAPRAESEAVLWYLGHCGWAIKTHRHLLIFDYWNPGPEPATPSLANGHIDPAEIADQHVVVFVTHGHRDHYDPSIFAWNTSVKDITYVYGFRPEELPENQQAGYGGPPYEYIGPRETRKIGDMEVRTIRSNDAGVGFAVSVDGLTLYHAGDHAGWAEGEKAGFTQEIDYLAEHVPHVDLAFLNVTGCHAHGPEPLREGTRYTLEKLKPQAMIPTHAGGREYIYRKVAEEAAAEGVTVRMLCPENRGDRLFYPGSKTE